VPRAEGPAGDARRDIDLQPRGDRRALDRGGSAHLGVRVERAPPLAGSLGPSRV